MSLLLGVIPELGILIENQKKRIFEIGHTEGKKRFYNAFVQFLNILENNTEPRPFIDDLQWLILDL